MATGRLDQPEKAKKARLDVETTEHSEDTEFNSTNPFTKGATPIEEDEVELKFDDGKSLYVSKGFLSLSSPVFKRMFKSNFKEKNERCISLCGKEYDVFLDMLLYLHPRIRKDLAGDWLTKVYEYAHEYQICTVLSAAEERLCEKVKNIKTDSYFYNDMPMNKLFDLLVFGERYSMSKLILTAANKFSAIPGRYVRNCNIYRSLSYHLKFLIADARLKKTDTDTYYSEKE